MSDSVRATGKRRREAPHILIVEDQPTTADMLGTYFGTQGYRVDTARWGKDALAFVEETVPDLVVLDIHLPDVDGYEICRHLRSHERTKHVPIIFLTQKRKQNAKLRGLELGAVDYVTKPFDIQELRLRVRNALQRPRSERPTDRITELPAGTLVDERLGELVEDGDRDRGDHSVLSIHLHGLKRFSEIYGFVARDDVVRSVAAILTHVRDEFAPGGFVGHLAASDFLLILPSRDADGVKASLPSRLNEALSFFYPYTDRQNRESDLPLNISVRALEPGSQAFKSVEAIKAWLTSSAQRKASDET